MNVTVISVTGLVLIGWIFTVVVWLRHREDQSLRKVTAYAKLRIELNEMKELLADQTKVVNRNTDLVAEALPKVTALEQRLGRLELSKAVAMPPEWGNGG